MTIQELGELMVEKGITIRAIPRTIIAVYETLEEAIESVVSDNG